MHNMSNQRLVDPTHKMLYLLTGKNPSEVRRRDKSIKFPVKVSAIKNVNPGYGSSFLGPLYFSSPYYYNCYNDVTAFFFVF